MTKVNPSAPPTKSISPIDEKTMRSNVEESRKTKDGKESEERKARKDEPEGRQGRKGEDLGMESEDEAERPGKKSGDELGEDDLDLDGPELHHDHEKVGPAPPRGRRD